MAPHRAKGEEGRERGRGRPSSSASGKTGHSPTTLEPGAKRQLDLAVGPSWGGNNNYRARKARGMACTRCRQPDGLNLAGAIENAAGDD